MKKLLVAMAGIVSLASASYFIGTVWAQQAATKPAAELPHKVALIDMAYVFKEYKKFDMLREDLKAEVMASEKQAKAIAEKVQIVQAELKSGTFKEGSPEFLERERQMATLTSEFETFRKLAQKEFLRKEAQIYHTIYLEASDAVDRFCKYYNYTLVLRFNREDLASNDPQKLIQGLNRQVIYFRPEDDITDSVLDFLNKKYASVAKPAAATAGKTAKKPAATGTRTN